MSATKASVLLSILLAACNSAPPPAPEVWGRLDGVPASDADKVRFRQDEAQCKYEWQQMAYMAPNRPAPNMGSYADPNVAAMARTWGAVFANPPPSYSAYLNCMGGRGWHRTG
jgi:hypothetical protein